jgi:enediyne polyketide synthase
LNHNQIAVIGMGSYYPGAKNLKELWNNILTRRQQFRQIPDQRLPLSEYYDENPLTPDKTYGKYAAVIDDFQFDWSSKRIPKSTYESTDIVHWLALETATQALTDANYTKGTIPQEKTGVIVGNSLTGEFMRSYTMRLRWPFVRKVLRATAEQQGLANDILLKLEADMEKLFKSVFTPVTEDTLAGNLSNTIAGRICNFFDLHGGGYVVDGACSSSLLAVATAADKLVHGDLDMAIAGGVDISIDPLEIIGFAKTKALTANDMNVFDQFSSGFIPGEGTGFVVLKRLEDARRDGDYIYGVLRGWGISSDGKGGITAPKVLGQARALERAYEMAGYSPHDLDFIEGHGTGTVVGDRVELEAIATVLERYGQPTPRSVGVTSFKSLVGHTKAAAGIGGLIKALLAVNQRVLVPTAGLDTPNEIFSTKAQALYPILHGKVYEPDRIMRAGISAMGFGGINCHVTIESGDLPKEELKTDIPIEQLLSSHQKTELFIFAASSLAKLTDKIDQALVDSKGMSIAELPDYAYQLMHNIENHSFRAAIIAGHPDQLYERLEKLQQKLQSGLTNGFYADPLEQIWISDGKQTIQSIGFLFPGQGSQFINMGRKLVERYDWAKEIAAEAWHYLPELERIMFCDTERALDAAQQKEWAKKLSQTEFSQVAICLVSVLWYEFLQRLGIKPNIVAGHSLGELSALYAAGAYDLSTLFHLAKTRGQAMASTPVSGVMASLQCNEETAERIIADIEGYVVVANINSAKQTVISGEETAVIQAIEVANKEGIVTTILPVSHAFHSEFMQNAAEELNRLSYLSESKELSIPFVSGMDGMKKLEINYDGVNYFALQAISQVNFPKIVATLRDDVDLLVEMGPGRILTGLVKADETFSSPCYPVETAENHEQDLQQLLAVYFIHGGNVAWELLYENRLIRRFVPAKDKLFITNPCELPLTVEAGSYALQPIDVKAHLIAKNDALDAAALDAYLQQRGDFLLDIIQADMRYLSKTKEQPKNHYQTVPALEKYVPEVSRTPLAVTSIDEKIIDEVAKFTGFDKKAIKLEYRLLDDLNLDSIKSAELVTKLIQTLEISDPIDVTEYSNASLAEIVEALEKYVPEVSRTPLAVASIDEKIIDEVAKFTGFDKKAIKLEYRLLDDLNLDSIKSAELINNCITVLGVTKHVDVTAYANASLLEIKKALTSTSKEQNAAVEREEVEIAPKPDTKQHVSLSDKNWVRNFSLIYQETPRQTNTITFLKTDHFLIVAEQRKNKLARELEQRLHQFGIKSTITTFIQLKQTNVMQQKAFSHLVVILPKTDMRNDILNTIDRLQSVIQPGKEYGYRASITYIQFGGGKFGNDLPYVPLDVCAAKAFAASLHQERPSAKIRVIDLHPKLQVAEISNEILIEIAAPEKFIAVGFDKDKRRLVPYSQVQNPATYHPRSIDWSSDDVILVTGGAKGITAECMLGVAKTIDAKLALVGSSAYETQPEVQKNIARFRELGVTCEYYQCDITKQDQVIDLIARVEEELGEITGFVHGAANLRSKRAEHISKQAFLAEISPKVFGAINLLQTLENRPLKLIVGFSSLAGVSGMAGNTSYGYSNEILRLMINNYEHAHPDTQTLVISFGLWDEVGMGIKGGVTDYLEKKGIYPIPVSEGVSRFVRLFQYYPNTNHVILTSRIKDFPTWIPKPVPRKKQYRFMEEVTYDHPGTEVIAKYHLDVKKDEFLQDHMVDGTPVFPAVFGMEAMAQAVSFVTGITDFRDVCIKDVAFQLPVVVDKNHGTTIEIRALVLEDGNIYTEVRSATSGFQKVHFSARFFFEAVGLVEEKVHFPEQALDLDLKTDFYQPILFHGPLYHRLEAIYEASSDLDHGEGVTLFTARSEVYEDFLLGDPYFNDALLHSARVITPQQLLLPVEISGFYIQGIIEKQGTWRGVARLVHRKGKHYTFVISLLDEANTVVQQITFKSYNFADLPTLPSTDEMVSISRKNEDLIIKKALQSYVAQHPDVKIPEIGIAYLPHMHQDTKKVRHQRIQPLFKRVAKQKGLHPNAALTWEDTGKPVIENTAMYVSISHDDAFAFITIDEWEQGCDILAVEERTEEDWLAILPIDEVELLHALQKQGDTLAVAGSRIWTCFEAIVKACGQSLKKIELKERVGDVVELRAYTVTSSYQVLTVPVALTNEEMRVISLVVNKEEKSVPSKVNQQLSKQDDLYGYFDPEKGFVYRFPLVFEDSSTISRRVNFTCYSKWMGKVREIIAAEIMEKVKEQMSSGIWGMATNFNQTEVYGEIEPDSVIEAHFQYEFLRGDSYFQYVCHWNKVLENGDLELVASTRQGMTWVEVVGHGEVKKGSYPPYFIKFIQDRLTGSKVVAKKSKFLSTDMLGELLYEGNTDPSNRKILRKQTFETTLEESNLVGNVYFSNYNKWQGALRDKYFYQIYPEIFKGTGQLGEWIPVRNSVHHLREAMPFDTILVEMSLAAKYKNGVKLFFEYFKLNEDGIKQKLAYGEQDVLWVKRDDFGAVYPKQIPEKISAVLDK